MTNHKLKFEAFETEKLSKNQQKKVRGGDGDGDIVPPNDPGKGKGGNGDEEQSQRISQPKISI